MKYTLADQVKNLITAYNENSTIQGDAIKAVLEPFKVPSYANRFTPDGLRKTIGEAMTAIMEDWKGYDTLLNQKLKLLLETVTEQAKKDLLLDDVKTPADYAARIANAREFLKMELDDERYAGKITPTDAKEIDTELHCILKDVIYDYNTMKQFKKMIETKVITFNGYNGDTIFPKTFGQFCKVESVMNALAELNADAESLFTSKRTPGADIIRINGNGYSIPIDAYSHDVGVENIVNNATIFDYLINSINDDGQEYIVSTGSNSATNGGHNVPGGFDANGQLYTATNPAPSQD
ncbi:hypothetical protein [Chakrabartyella piscis]|uniref:hypothetical protein n=1 Tax=Chakrabartyella piscis TaxID=2918914 RepID=UPI0029583FBE|nr:hypothetical protein [Chakrabartyella piscis]